MNGGQRRDLQRVEHAQDVQLPFLGEIRGVGEEREGDVHVCNIDRSKVTRLLSTHGFDCGETVTPGRATSTTRPGVWLTDLSLVGMALIWGVNFSVVKFGTTLVDPLAYNGLRVALAAARSGRDRRRRPDAAAAACGPCWRCSGSACSGNGVYQFLFVEGHRAHERERRRARRRRVAGVHRASSDALRGVERISAAGAFGIASVDRRHRARRASDSARRTTGVVVVVRRSARAAAARCRGRSTRCCSSRTRSAFPACSCRRSR